MSRLPELAITRGVSVPVSIITSLRGVDVFARYNFFAGIRAHILPERLAWGRTIVSVRFLLTLLACCAVREASALEIWLARTPACNSCGIFEEASDNRHYGEGLRYRDGDNELVIPIRHVRKSELARAILSQLPGDSGVGSPDWQITLTVLVVDRGRVLASGNIAESADNRLLRHSPAVMFPPTEPGADDPALVGEDLHANFFSTHWNLEYFIDVALGKRAARQPTPLVDLESPRPWDSGIANVILWGSAGTPLDNALFISQRMMEIRSDLDSLNIDDVQFVTLYGHGPQVSGNDTSYIVDGEILFRRADLAADLSSSGESLNRVLTGIRRNPASHSLLIQVGHSGPVGSPLWGSGLSLMPEDLAALKHKSAAKLVMISGACHGGMFAKAVQCGFFAAHPDVVATGCQLSPKALETSDDYLRYFFRAATTRPAGKQGVAIRTSATRPATLAEAHWDASVRLEDHQISYTTTDALIDDYFAAHPEQLPAAMSVSEIRRASHVLDSEESRALETLVADLAADLSIPLTGYVESNETAQARLADARELSSDERNRIIAMPYKLMLPVLARRIVYKSLDVQDPEFRTARECEMQSIPSFLNVDAG